LRILHDGARATRRGQKRSVTPIPCSPSSPLPPDRCPIYPHNPGQPGARA